MLAAALLSLGVVFLAELGDKSQLITMTYALRHRWWVVLAGVGIAYFGNADYAKAVKDISAGLAKGVSKEATDARLSLGVAQLKSGDKDAAVKTFRQVKDDPVSERLAALWILRAKS